jgi:hypothetical protein
MNNSLTLVGGADGPTSVALVGLPASMIFLLGVGVLALLLVLGVVVAVIHHKQD